MRTKLDINLPLDMGARLRASGLGRVLTGTPVWARTPGACERKDRPLLYAENNLR